MQFVRVSWSHPMYVCIMCKRHECMVNNIFLLACGLIHFTHILKCCRHRSRSRSINSTILYMHVCGRAFKDSFSHQIPSGVCDLNYICYMYSCNWPHPWLTYTHLFRHRDFCFFGCYWATKPIVSRHAEYLKTLGGENWVPVLRSPLRFFSRSA